MNLGEAFKIYHTSENTYGGTIHYSPKCIYCNNVSSKSLMNDGGSFRQCDRCRKNFRAVVINNAINNLSYSTQHLRGTN